VLAPRSGSASPVIALRPAHDPSGVTDRSDHRGPRSIPVDLRCSASSRRARPRPPGVIVFRKTVDSGACARPPGSPKAPTAEPGATHAGQRSQRRNTTRPGPTCLPSPVCVCVHLAERGSASHTGHRGGRAQRGRPAPNLREVPCRSGGRRQATHRGRARPGRGHLKPDRLVLVGLRRFLSAERPHVSGAARTFYRV
jgi:hypothetical protein